MKVLHAADACLVVCKPPGLLAQADRSGDPDVLTLARRRLREETGAADPFLGLVHRLDRPTSGLMVLARTPEAARALSRQFRERTVSKTYLALVEGTLRGIGAWTDYIAKPERQPMLVPPDHPEGKRAALEWQALGRGRGRTLLRIQLRTGRPHQIRLQATDRGHPVVGDERYGADREATIEGIALHHAILRADLPGAPRRQTFVAAPPDTWRALMTEEMHAALRRTLRQATPDRPPSDSAETP